MGLFEILALVGGGLAALFGFLYKGQVKKTAKLEQEKESFQELAERAVKQQDAFVLSEKEELEAVEEIKRGLENEEISDIELTNMLNGVRDKSN